MSYLALIRNQSEAWERTKALIEKRPLFQTWPAVGGLLLIGPGMLSAVMLGPNAPIVHASGLNLDIAYAPVAHMHQPFTLVLSTMSVFGTKGHFNLRVGEKLLENFSIASITPDPVAQTTSDGEEIYSFAGGGKDAVTLTLVPEHTGRTAATLQYGLDPPIPFSLTTVP